MFHTEQSGSPWSSMSLGDKMMMMTGLATFCQIIIIIIILFAQIQLIKTAVNTSI